MLTVSETKRKISETEIIVGFGACFVGSMLTASVPKSYLQPPIFGGKERVPTTSVGINNKSGDLYFGSFLDVRKPGASRAWSLNVNDDLSIRNDYFITKLPGRHS